MFNDCLDHLFLFQFLKRAVSLVIILPQVALIELVDFNVLVRFSPLAIDDINAAPLRFYDLVITWSLFDLDG